MAGAVGLNEGCPDPHPVAGVYVPRHAPHGQRPFAFGQGEDEGYCDVFPGPAFKATGHREVDPAEGNIVNCAGVYDSVFIRHQSGGE